MEYVLFNDPILWKSVALIALNPLFWNIVGQMEYSRHTISKLFLGKKKLAITVIGVVIVILNYLRTTMFNAALESQPQFPMSHPVLFILSIFLVGAGQVLVISSFYKLGFYATFLGDYFGVFVHDAPITSFPYSICGDPMYWGSALSYFGLALGHSSIAGLLLATWVSIVYKIAIIQESKMLKLIYSKKE